MGGLSKTSLELKIEYVFNIYFFMQDDKINIDRLAFYSRQWKAMIEKNSIWEEIIIIYLKISSNLKEEIKKWGFKIFFVLHCFWVVGPPQKLNFIKMYIVNMCVHLIFTNASIAS